MAENVIKGLDQIKAQLKKLEDKVVNNINRSAANAGATALRKAAQNNLPPDHRKKLGQQRSRRQSKKAGFDVYSIGPLREHWGLIFLEYGADPHEITPKRRKKLKFPDNGFAGTISHPGIRATRFLSRALTEADNEAYDAVSKQYWKRIKKALK